MLAQRPFVDPDLVLAAALLALTEPLMNRGADAAAEKCVEEALEILDRLYPNGHPSTAAALAKHGWIHVTRDRPDEAEPLMRRAVAMAEKLFRRGHPIIPSQKGQLAYSLILQDKHAEAQEIYLETLAYIDDAKATELMENWDPRIPESNYRSQLGYSLNCTGDHAEAEKHLRRCLEFRAEEMPEHWMFFNAKKQLGRALLGQEKFEEAVQWLLEGYNGIYERRATMPPPAKDRIPEALEYLTQLYEATGNETEAAKWRSKLEAARAKLTNGNR